MKKVLVAVSLILCMLMTACTTNSSASLTFNVETGDSIKITLDTADGYKLSADGGNFIVSQNDETILQGIFLTTDMYAEYETSIREVGTILEDTDGFLFYQIDGNSGMESDFLYMVPDSNTGVIIASLAEQDVANAAFDRLTFENTAE